MVKAAALVAGDGTKLQAILDSMYFKEIPDFELVAVISPQKDAYAMARALNAGVPAYVVDPELFPTMTSHSMAVANKLAWLACFHIVVNEQLHSSAYCTECWR